MPDHMFGGIAGIRSSFKETLLKGILLKRRATYVFATKKQRAYMKKKYKEAPHIFNIHMIDELVAEINTIDDVVITRKYILGCVKNAKRRL